MKVEDSINPPYCESYYKSSRLKSNKQEKKSLDVQETVKVGSGKAETEIISENILIMSDARRTKESRRRDIEEKPGRVERDIK